MSRRAVVVGVPRSGTRRARERVAVSNQTVKADEANYREALALIGEARAGLFPTISAIGSATHDRIAGPVGRTSRPKRGHWTLDVWGQARRGIEAQAAGAEASAANLANATLAAQAALALAYVTLTAGGFAPGPAHKDGRRL